MPSKYKIFFGKARCPLVQPPQRDIVDSPWTPSEHLAKKKTTVCSLKASAVCSNAHRPTFCLYYYGSKSYDHVDSSCEYHMFVVVTGLD